MYADDTEIDFTSKSEWLEETNINSDLHRINEYFD